MKKLLFTLTGSLLLAVAYGITNVSGGIYANTTWTLANSPYIITDTVVVFPGVTLTIEPGVEVKFDNGKSMEVRQANIFAEGTITDSITFTSNAVSPVAGMYNFWLNNYPAHTVSKFNYCNFHYGTNGLYDYGLTDSLTIRNSNFTYNSVGLYATGGYVWVDSCNISNNVNEGVYKPYGTLNYCTVSHNQTGIFSPGGTVQYCTIEYNQIGLNVASISILSSKINYNQTGVISLDNNITINHCIVDSNTVIGLNLHASGGHIIENSEIKYNNGIGIEVDGQQSHITMCDIENNITGITEHGTSDNIYCNTICNNTTYNFYYAGTTNISVVNNNWCSNDSATVKSHIYDGYIDITRGLVFITPFDTVGCYLYYGIPSIAEQTSVFTIYPNPTANSFTINKISSNETSLLQVFNPLGEIVYTQKLFGKNEYVVETNFAKGLYYVRVKDVVRKLVVE